MCFPQNIGLVGALKKFLLKLCRPPHHKWSTCTRTSFVQRPRHRLFARTRFARHQRRSKVGGDPLKLRADAANRNTVACKIIRV